MSGETIEALSMTVIITSVAVVEIRKLRLATVAYVLQALLIVALLLSFAAENSALYGWAVTALITKAILVPLALFWAIRKTNEREIEPVIGFVPSVVVAILLMVGFFRTPMATSTCWGLAHWHRRNCSRPTWQWPQRSSRWGCIAC